MLIDLQSSAEAGHAELGLPTRDGCRICGNQQRNLLFHAREMQFGIPGEFCYLECGACHCLQLHPVPDDLDRYYPKTYYSLAADPEPTDQALINYKHFQRMRVSTHHSILDVGSGTGALLLGYARDGYQNLTGIDPYLSQDICYPQGVRIYKRTLEQMDGEFDLVVCHHAFEHMVDPLEALTRLRSLVKRGRYLFLRIPVADCFAWRHYGRFWVQLDAPRHVYLHTEKSIALLAQRAGFRVTHVEYDSNVFQFWGSEEYLKGRLLSELELDPLKSVAQEVFETWNQHARTLNGRRHGDQACFDLLRD